MKVMILSTDFKPRSGGIAEVAHRLSAGLAARGHQVDVVTYRVESEPDDSVCAGYRVRRCFDRQPTVSAHTFGGAGLAGKWCVQALGQIMRQIRSTAPDVLFMTNYHPWLWQGVMRLSTRPKVFFFHGEDLEASMQSPFSRRLLASCVRLARVCFCNSSHTLRLLSELPGHGLFRGEAVGCAVDREEIVSEDRRDEARNALGWGDEPVLITVSRVVLRKGIDTTMKALKRVVERVQDCRYVVVGDGADREALAELAKVLEIDDHVEFTGFVDEDVRRSLYFAADVYVMPSRTGRRGTEGFGISFLEANAHGLPVIGSTVGGIPDAVTDGENGLLVDPYDVEDLAEKIVRLLRNPEERRRMAINGQHRIRTRYNWDAIVGRIETRLKASVGHDRT